MYGICALFGDDRVCIHNTWNEQYESKVHVNTTVTCMPT